MSKLMGQNTNISVIPGGFEEATLSSNKEQRIFIKERKGFIKYALRYGYKIQPVFVIGERKMYNYIEIFVKQRLFLNKFKMVGAIFFSRLFLVPFYGVKVHTVVGKAIQIPHIHKPTDEDVDKYHKIYVKEVQDLYQRHKDKAQEESDLIIY